MEANGIVPTMNVGSDGLGLGNGLWIFAILVLFLFGGSGFGGRGNPATVEDLNNTSNFTRLESQVRANAQLTETKTDAINNGICSLSYQLSRDYGAITTQMAKDVNEINSVTIAQTQKILDAMAQNKIEALQAKINSLELAQATGNVVRYPNSFVYASTCNPFCCGCGNNNI